MIVHNGIAARPSTWAAEAGISVQCLRYRLSVGEDLPHDLRKPAPRTPKTRTWADMSGDDQAGRVEFFARISGTPVSAVR